MKMRDLLQYGVPEAVVDLWRQSESDTLLPLQALAVKRHGLFDEGNILVQAPTSSGKTFIGEMAAIQTALRRKRVVYVVPLKALAVEKYRDFAAKYEPYGLRVVISTRDHREHDAAFEAGHFSIAVVVYEKLAQLLVRRPEGLAELDLIVADELELLSDLERGSMAEVLLTRILASGRRLIGLSAVIGEAERLAQWMRASLVQYERRPVELRYGVLQEGIFKYRTYNEDGEGEEYLVGSEGESAWEVLTQNVCTFAERGEACMIFVKSRHESRRGAELLAERVAGDAASTAMEALAELEGTRSRDSLLRTLENGVAFHNADLSPEERERVEDAFRQGEVKVLVSTSTLAVGLNLPAQNVFITAEKWCYDHKLGLPWKTPLLHSEYENMGGRAGRYGEGYDFGRSILIATSPFDQETLWRRYVDGEREKIVPRLAKEPLENHVLRLVASRFCQTPETLFGFLESTLSGRWIWADAYTAEEIQFRIRAAVNRCIDDQMMVEKEEGFLEVTPVGGVVASKGIAIASARELLHWILESEKRDWSPIDLIFAAASTPDGRMLQVMLTTKEYEHADYVGQLKRTTLEEPLEADVPINRIRNCNLMPFFEEVRTIKVTLFLNEWIEHAPLCDLEERYDTMAGQLLSGAEQVAWLIDATGAIAIARGCDAAFADGVQRLSQRLQHGLRESLLPLARVVGDDVKRSTLLALETEGLDTPEALHTIPLQVLTHWIPEVAARRLQLWATAQAETDEPVNVAPTTVKPILIVDDGRPGEILLDGQRVVLQEKQYRLIRVLAEEPGNCIPYETIYTAVWGDTIVENNQMHFQKRKLLKAIAAVSPQHEKLVQTVAKRGFVLNLIQEEVLVKQGSMTAAA